MNDAQNPPVLKAHIGLMALTLYGVGDILGAGIYGLVGKAAGVMGSAVWMGFLVSMVAAMLTGLSYAALGSRFPKAAGGSYVVFRVFRSPFFAYLIGLTTLASGVTSMATASKAFAGYLVGLLPWLGYSGSIFLFATVLALIVFIGIKESIWANSVCTLIELFGLLVVIGVGVSYLGTTNLMDMTTVTNPTGDFSWSLIFSGAVLTFYSFVGFEDILNVSEEVKNPRYTVPRGLILAVIISSVIYMLVSLVGVSVLSVQELADSKEPLVEVVGRAAPWFPLKIYSVIALFAVANTALLNFIMASRLVYGLSRLKLMPKMLDHVHPKRQTPSRAVFFIYLLLLVLVCVGDISTLAKATSLLLLLVFCGMNLSLAWMKYQKDSTPTGFDVPMLVPVAGFIVCCVMISFSKLSETIIAGVIILLITALYFFLRPSVETVQEMLNEE